MSIQNQNNRLTIRNLAVFIVIVTAIGWIGWGLDVLMDNPPSQRLGMLLWVVTPLGVTVLLRTFAGDGWKDFGIRPRLKGNVGWYVIGLLVYPVVIILVLIVGGGLGLITFPNLSPSTPGMLLQAFALGLLPMFFKNIFEEFPWRGHLAPKVYSLGLNDFIGHLIVGLVWASWHIPYFLTFLDRAVLQSYTTLDLAVFIPLAVVAMLSWAIVFGEIRLLTNSVWPAVLMHMVEDAFLNPLLIEGYIQIAPGMDWLMSPGFGILSIILFIAIGVGLRQLRLRKRKRLAA